MGSYYFDLKACAILLIVHGQLISSLTLKACDMLYKLQLCSYGVVNNIGGSCVDTTRVLHCPGITLSVSLGLLQGLLSDQLCCLVREKWMQKTVLFCTVAALTWAVWWSDLLCVEQADRSGQ